MDRPITMRIQILPNGIIIGHVIPKEHPANGIYDMTPNHVYEYQLDMTYGHDKLVDIGEADVNMKNRQYSIDELLATSGGMHLTVKGGK